MIIIVEFIGTLLKLANTRKRAIHLQENATISTLLSKLNEEFSKDKENFHESNLLIMKKGREISVLNGLGTNLKNNDKITLIPISHGG